MNLKQKFVLGMVTGIGGFGLKTILNILVIPVIIQSLGANSYGLYVLCINLSELLLMTSNGLNRSVIHRLSQSFSLENWTGYQDQLRIGFWTYAGASFLILLAGGVIVPLVVPWLHWSNVNNLEYLFWLALADGALSVFASFYRSVLMAHSRYSMTNIADTVHIILCNTGAFALLLMGYPLISLLVWRLLMSTLQALWLWSKTHEHWMETSLHPKHLNAGNTVGFLQVTGPANVLMVCNLVSTRIDNFVIGLFMSMQAVATYAIVFRIFGQINYLSARLAEGIFPIMTRLDALSEHDRSRVFFLRSSQFLNFLVGFLLLWIWLDYRPIFDFLTRGQLVFKDTLPVVAAFIPIVWSYVVSTSANNYLFANGQYHLQVRWSLLSALSNITLSLLLVKPLGLLGVALGSTIPTLCEQQLGNVRRACQSLHISLPYYLVEVYGRCVIPWLMTALVLLTGQWFVHMHLWHFPWSFFGSGIMAFFTGFCVWFLLNTSPTEKRHLFAWVEKSVAFRHSFE